MVEWMHGWIVTDVMSCSIKDSETPRFENAS